MTQDAQQRLDTSSSDMAQRAQHSIAGSGGGGSARGAEMLKSASRGTGWSKKASPRCASGTKMSRATTENAFATRLLHARGVDSARELCDAALRRGRCVVEHGQSAARLHLPQVCDACTLPKVIAA